jgi:hypothetical protein
MRAALVITAALIATSSLAFAGNNNGGKNSNSSDRSMTSSLKGNGLNIDGTADDAAKCRSRTAGAALCGQRHKKTGM